LYYAYGMLYLSIFLGLAYVTYRGYFSNPKRKENKLFLFLGVVALIWLFGEVGLWFSDTIYLIIGFVHVKYIGLIMVGPAVFLFANAVPIWRNILNSKYTYYAIAVFIVIFEIISISSPFTNLFFAYYYEELMAPGKYTGKWTYIWWIYAVCEYIFLLSGVVSIAISGKQAKTKVEKAQSRIFILAVLIPLVANVFELSNPITPDPTSIAMGIYTILVGYALSKYKLLVITPETEKMDGVKAKIPFQVEHGYNYVIVDNHTNAPYFLLRALSTQRPGLCVTGKPPQVVRNTFKIEKLPIIWVTEVETAEQSANPGRLDFEIAQSIINFMRENPGSTVLIDDIEYLTTKCGFDAVSNFLKDLVDVASTTNSTFIVQVRPAFFEEENVRVLTAMFDKELKLPEIKPENKESRTFLYYRRADSLEKISSRIPPSEKVLVITRTHPRKVEKYFGKADYYWITDLDISDVKTIRPEEVDTGFILAIKSAISSGVKHLVIDGCDVVKLRVDFPRYLGFVKDLTDLAHKHNVRLYCVIETSDEKENVAVSNRFDVVVK
ncbi:MAG: DUF835 domain-containing protein, partial [Thermoplasmata archaeon]